LSGKYTVMGKIDQVNRSTPRIKPLRCQGLPAAIP
jgi:hypothetical protein